MKTGPKYKICRRLGERVFGKCQTAKFTISGAEKKRKTGKHPKSAPSEFALQLLEKQKARFTYGISEKQFSNYVEIVRKHQGANRTAGLSKLLETRLDNVVFRLGLAASRSLARQLVSHGHIAINGKRIRVPSYSVKQGDLIKVVARSVQNKLFENLDEKLKNHATPEWLSFDVAKKEGMVKGEPVFGQTEANINYEAILEFYSR